MAGLPFPTGLWLCLEPPGPQSPLLPCLPLVDGVLVAWECSCFLGACCHMVNVVATHVSGHLWCERRLAAFGWPHVLPTSACPSRHAGWPPQSLMGWLRARGPGAGWTLALSG